MTAIIGGNAQDLISITPQQPHIAFVESFNGRFRDSCLNQHWFRDIEEALQEIDSWQQHYNEVRQPYPIIYPFLSN